MKLKDPKLFRQQCYIDGEWVDADDGEHDRGRQSRDGAACSAPCRRWAPPRRGAPSRPPSARLPAWRAQDRQGARRDPAQLVRPDDGEPGRPRAADDRRAGQAARRSRAARSPMPPPSSSGSPRKPSASTATPSPAIGRDKRIVVLKQPIGVVRRDHAVEFPGGDDHAQGRARRSPPAAPMVLKPADADAVLRAGAGRARRARRRAEGRVQRRHRLAPRRSAAS